MVNFDDFRPMLLTERHIDFEEPGWLWEIQFDGYRLMALCGDGPIKLRTRSGADATAWFPEVAMGLSKFRGGPCILDGEICVLDQLGRSDFAAIHERVQRRRVYAGAPPVTYCVFDLLAVRGVDLSQRPLIRRKLALSKFLAAPPPSTLLVSYIKGRAEQVFHEAVIPLRLEGLVAKWADSVYQSGIRSNDWVKVKRKACARPCR